MNSVDLIVRGGGAFLNFRLSEFSILERYFITEKCPYYALEKTDIHILLMSVFPDKSKACQKVRTDPVNHFLRSLVRYFRPPPLYKNQAILFNTVNN